MGRIVSRESRGVRRPVPTRRAPGVWSPVLTTIRIAARYAHLYEEALSALRTLRPAGGHRLVL
jgi:hypothetical protein